MKPGFIEVFPEQVYFLPVFISELFGVIDYLIQCYSACPCILGTHAGRKMRGYRAANALERIQGSLQTLFETEDTSGSVALKAELVSIFSHLSQHYGGEKLSAAGLDIASLKENFVDISKQSRRRFAKAVFERENLLENLFLKSYSQNENGLIEVLREAIKAELKKSDGSTGALVSTFA